MKNRITSCVFWLTLAITALGTCLAGCGQRGSLYLPDEPQQHDE
jgi:predicted small lipoprotein YifL